MGIINALNLYSATSMSQFRSEKHQIFTIELNKAICMAELSDWLSEFLKTLPKVPAATRYPTYALYIYYIYIRDRHPQSEMLGLPRDLKHFVS